MKIQLAIDRMSIADGIAMASRVAEHVDWIEIGTSLIKEFGMESVRAFREAFPEKVLLADMKTFDNARYEFELCYAAGADVATVMGAAPLVSVEACREVAERCGKQVMVDLLNTSPAQVEALADWEKAIFCAHVSKDQQELGGQSVGFAHLTELGRKMPRLAVAGGIGVETLPALAPAQPEVVIVGSAITKATDPVQAAAELKAAIERLKGDGRHA